MAMFLPYLAALLAPVVTKLFEEELKAAVSWLFKKLKGRVKEEVLEHQMKSAIEKGKVESFIAKYDKELTPKVKTKLRALARMKNLLESIEKTLKKKRYTERAAESFIELAKLFEEVLEGTSFEEAGIKKIMVKDTETGEEVAVTNEEYMVALLLRFAAAVWTQFGKRSTPESEGWALEYDAKIEVPEFFEGGPSRSAVTG
ncbi:MAG: hypothetical protein ACFFCO_03160, partial [Promethearchaeota archaeon]